MAVPILSILLNPHFFAALDRFGPWLEHQRAASVIEIPVDEPVATDLPTISLKDHMVQWA